MIPNDIKITPQLVAEHGLKPDEYQRFLHLIGREPTITELGIVSAMWNEHCSYKSSKIHLKTLPTKRATVEEALRLVVQQHRQRRALQELAGLGWEGDLDAMRRVEVSPDRQ